MMSDAAAKSMSGGRLFAIFGTIGAVICILLVVLFEKQLVQLNADRDAALQAEYAAFDELYPADDVVSDAATDGEAVVEDAAAEDVAPAE